MAQEYYCLVTNKGVLKEASANAPGGSPVKLTTLAIGDANGTPYNPTSSATSLVHEVYRTSLTNIVIDDHNPSQIIAEGVINEEAGPFYIREVGIFDSEGDLFAIGKYPETFKPALASGSGKRLYIRMILGFASTPQVNLIISDDINNDPNFSSRVNAALAERLSKTENLADLKDVTAARKNLGLEIGTNVQAYSTNLSALSSLAGSANKLPYFTGAGQLATIDLYPNRNAIINGGFLIWQRGSFFRSPAVTYTPSGIIPISITGANVVYTADRWFFAIADTSAQHFISLTSDAPTVAQAGRLFNSAIHVDCQAIDTTVAKNSYVLIGQAIEGYNFLALAGRPFTLSFWVKATKPGIYCVSFANKNLFHSYVAEYTINQTDTWEFKVITVPAITDDGLWTYREDVGLYVIFTLMAGSDRCTSPGVWTNNEYIATPNQVNACDNTLNNFTLCAVQLEAGSVATPFESKKIQEELELCQRYYEKSYHRELVAGEHTDQGQNAYSNQNGQANIDTVRFRVQKRENPAVMIYSPTGTPGKMLVWSSYTDIDVSVYGSTNSFTIRPSSPTITSELRYHWVAECELPYGRVIVRPI